MHKYSHRSRSSVRHEEGNLCSSASIVCVKWLGEEANLLRCDGARVGKISFCAVCDAQPLLTHTSGIVLSPFSFSNTISHFYQIQTNTNEMQQPSGWLWENFPIFRLTRCSPLDLNMCVFALPFFFFHCLQRENRLFYRGGFICFMLIEKKAISMKIMYSLNSFASFRLLSSVSKIVFLARCAECGRKEANTAH